MIKMEMMLMMITESSIVVYSYDSVERDENDRDGHEYDRG